MDRGHDRRNHRASGGTTGLTSAPDFPPDDNQPGLLFLHKSAAALHDIFRISLSGVSECARLDEICRSRRCVTGLTSEVAVGHRSRKCAWPALLLLINDRANAEKGKPAARRDAKPPVPGRVPGIAGLPARPRPPPGVACRQPLSPPLSRTAARRAPRPVRSGTPAAAGAIRVSPKEQWQMVKESGISLWQGAIVVLCLVHPRVQ
jgi:hypothetical protein